VTPEVVAVATAMAACSCCASTMVACSREAAVAAWTVVMAATKSDGVTSEAADVTTIVLGSVGSGVSMAEVGSDLGSGSTPGADGPGLGADGSGTALGRA
jgi:hypothetical protein